MIFMAVLSSKAQALLSLGRVALRPTAADRSRVQSALWARLDIVGSRSRPAAGGSKLVPGIIVGVGLVGGALFFALRHGEGPVIAQPRSVTLTATATAAPVIEAAPEQPVLPPALPVAPAAESASASSRPVADSLAQEVALLSRATSDLHRGNAADALRALNDHARRFPNGLLSEERRGARAQALCLLGRTSEAQAELARLAPHSPAAARARFVCRAALGADAE